MCVIKVFLGTQLDRAPHLNQLAFTSSNRSAPGPAIVTGSKILTLCLNTVATMAMFIHQCACGCNVHP